MIEIHPLSCVGNATIGADVRIDAFAVIRDGVVIGDRVKIHPHAVIESGVTIEHDAEVFAGACLGKRPIQSRALARQPDRHAGNVVIGPNSFIGCYAVIYSDVVIGTDALISDGASIREHCRIGDATIVGRYVTLNYNITVGRRVKIMDHCWLAGNMTIEDDVFISGGVMTANDKRPGTGGYHENMQGPTIRRKSMVGVGAILLPTIVIGEGAVVAAGAVVTKDVAAGSVVMGIPARAKPE